LRNITALFFGLNKITHSIPYFVHSDINLLKGVVSIEVSKTALLAFL